MPKGTIKLVQLNTSAYEKAHGRKPGGKGSYRFKSAEDGRRWPVAPVRGNYVEVCQRLHDAVAQGDEPSGRWDVLPEK